jgi:hypothetical protein
MSIHTSLVFIDPGPGQGSKGSSNKLLSVTCAGSGHDACLYMTCRYLDVHFWYSGLNPPLTVTDTGSLFIPARVYLQAERSGISPSHNPIPKRFDQQGTNAVGSVNRKFGFTHYLYTLCCHGNTDKSYIILLTNNVK